MQRINVGDDNVAVPLEITSIPSAQELASL